MLVTAGIAWDGNGGSAATRAQFDLGAAANGGFIPPDCITGILDLCTREWLYRSEDFVRAHVRPELLTLP